jgi:hypothetical protein
MVKKRGRKKKRGPKKKKKEVIHTYVGLKRPYHIITTNNGVQIKDIYSAVDLPKALKKMQEYQEKYNKDILFPVKFVSNRAAKTFVNADYRLMLIKKCTEDEPQIGKIKNEFGKFVDCVTSSDNWAFIDELPYELEETFWVYGYNPKTDRKTCQFILDTFITYDKFNKYYFKEIVVYRNKLLINSVEGLNIIICKNHQDSVRLYNTINDYCKEKKYKNITFGGDIVQYTYGAQIWLEKIQELTHWTRRKINKNTTRD